MKLPGTSLSRLLAGALLLAGLGVFQGATARGDAAALPDPAVDPAAGGHTQVAVLAGGCFWGLQAVFEHVKGVEHVWAGYSGGNADTADYDIVSEGESGHAESVKIVYDPAQVSYGQLLKVYFSVAHDPTQLDRQGPDVGKQYRSVVFYGDAAQKQVAQAYLAQLGKAGAFARPVVTELVPLKAFYTAEDYHQDYARLHPNDPYIVYNDAPKVAALKRMYPALYRPQGR
jgi:peptide-methionine (S)-S-oxide reductase